MFNDRNLWDLTRANQKEVLAWAQQERLLKEINVAKSDNSKLRLWQRVVGKIGDISIAFGHWLKRKPIL